MGGTAVRNFSYVVGYMMLWIFCFQAIFLAKCNMSQSTISKLAILTNLMVDIMLASLKMKGYMMGYMMVFGLQPFLHDKKKYLCVG